MKRGGKKQYYLLVQMPGSALSTSLHSGQLIYGLSLTLYHVRLLSLWVHRLVMGNQLLLIRQCPIATLFSAHDYKRCQSESPRGDLTDKNFVSYSPDMSRIPEPCGPRGQGIVVNIPLGIKQQMDNKDRTKRS